MRSVTLLKLAGYNVGGIKTGRRGGPVRGLLIALATLCVLALHAERQPQDKLQFEPVRQTQTYRIQIDQADFLRHDDKIGKNTQSLNGSVKLSHQNTQLFCDSAYMYNDSNMVICYGSVHVIQGDSVHLYGDRMLYYGDLNLVKVRDNVRANKGNAWLYTNHLDYDRVQDCAYFFNGGRLVNGDNTLESRRGVFYTQTNDVFFKDSVRGHSKRMELISDTTKFNTHTEIVTILGPTNIQTDDSTVIDSELGWYDTKSNVAKLLRNNRVWSMPNRSTLLGRTILYERARHLGTAWDDVVLTDSVDDMVLRGDYGYFDQTTKAALCTQRAELLQIYKNDTVFMHADTFRVVPLADTSRLVKAYHQVKVFRIDLQARCDSMVYDFRDSIATLYNFPVVWSDNNQMTGNVIKLYTRQRTVYKAELIDAAMMVMQEPDTVGFDQIKGKLITGHIRHNELYKVDVNGSGQTIYYPRDGDDLIGVNRAESSNMVIRLRNKRISEISMLVSPSGRMNPPFLIGEDDCKLAGFKWLQDYRPLCRDDIFKPLDIPDELTVVPDTYQGYEFDDLGDETEVP